MPSKYNSTAKKPGKAVKKPYKRGGRMRRNLRDEEARVIGVQDDAADELRRVRARRPHDARERADKRAELARVGARGRDAREEMHRLRDKAVGLGLKRGGRTKADNPEGDGRGSYRKYMATRRFKGLNTGGTAKKQGYNDRLDESLGMRNRKTKAAPKKKAPVRRTARATLPNDINQHKRMAMGEDVLTGRMLKKGGKAIKKKTGGQTLKSRRKESEGAEKAAGRRKYAAVGTMDKGNKKVKRSTGGRAPATTGVRLNMGAPKSKTIKARGMGAATRGGQFRTNT